MAETTKPGAAKATFTCERHGLQSGSDCPICLYFSAPKTAEPIEEPGWGFRAHAMEFWRGYGKLTLGAFALALVVSMFPYTTTRPTAYDPTPHRQAITELETVLFYEGATDTTQHPPMVVSLLEAVETSVEKDEATFKRAELITQLKELKDQVRVQTPGTYRLSLTRQRWLTLRVSFFDAAPWFRTNSGVLDQLQAKTQGSRASAGTSEIAAQQTGDTPRSAPAPPPSAQALLGMLDDYERAVERYVARAGSLAAQACDAEGGAGATYSSQLSSLSNDTLEELSRIIGDNETARQRLSSVAGSAQNLVRRRNGLDCGNSGSPTQIYAREHASFKEIAKDTRRNIEANPPGA